MTYQNLESRREIKHCRPCLLRSSKRAKDPALAGSIGNKAAVTLGIMGNIWYIIISQFYIHKPSSKECTVKLCSTVSYKALLILHKANCVETKLSPMIYNVLSMLFIALNQFRYILFILNINLWIELVHYSLNSIPFLSFCLWAVINSYCFSFFILQGKNCS